MAEVLDDIPPRVPLAPFGRRSSMVWEPEIEEIRHRKSLAERMGGEERVARQHSEGKLTVRERIDMLADPGSFQEIGKLTGSAQYDENGKLEAFTPKGSVIGTCRVDGRKVVLNGGDFTVKSHGGGGGGMTPSMNAAHMALQYRLPYIRLLDGFGGSVTTFEQIGRTYIPINPGTYRAEELLQSAPVVSAVLGSVAGLPAVEGCLAHFNVIVKDTAVIFPGGPPVVKASLGYDISKWDLGDYRTQAYEAGVVDNVAENEEEAFKIIRRFLSYLPSNVWQMPPRAEPTDDPSRRDEDLLSVISRKRTRTYDPYAILNAVVDRDSLFEICPFYGPSRITALARFNGYPVGVMINNPRRLGGSMDVAAGSKVIRFIQLCDTFHLPMIYFADEPGFMVGLEEQKKGIVRAGARIICVTQNSRMPWFTIVIRQIYGVAGQCHDRAMRGMFKRVAWPSGHWGSMHIEGGTRAGWRREIEAAPDPKAKEREIEERLLALASPFRTAEGAGIEDIIDPRDTRPIVCEFVEDAQDILKTQLGPTPGLGFLP
jgi:acetyl-CoA carboxylase carboxyltransferase component